MRAGNNGFGNFGSLRLMDATPGVTETATISGNVNFADNTYVGVDGGGANPDRLIFTGVLASGSSNMHKVGAGEMEVAGASDNGVTFAGAPSPWDDGITVRAGTLYLNKTGATAGDQRRHDHDRRRRRRRQRRQADPDRQRDRPDRR